jgi:hypothetical protein
MFVHFVVITGATEMIYVPMNMEIRYVGKEFVRFFGQKGGKSVASVLLSAVNAHLSLSLRIQSLFCGVLIACWCVVMVVLGLHLGEKASSEEYEEMIEVAQTEGRNRLDSIESNASQEEMEALPDDDYFVGEGLSMNSDSVDPMDANDPLLSVLNKAGAKGKRGADNVSSGETTSCDSSNADDNELEKEFRVSSDEDDEDFIAGTVKARTEKLAQRQRAKQARATARANIAPYSGDISMDPHDVDNDYNMGYSDGYYIMDDMDVGMSSRRGAHSSRYHTGRSRTQSMPVAISSRASGTMTTSKIQLHQIDLDTDDIDSTGMGNGIYGLDSVDKLRAMANSHHSHTNSISSPGRRRLPSADDGANTTMQVEYVDVVMENWERQPSPADGMSGHAAQDHAAAQSALRYRGCQAPTQTQQQLDATGYTVDKQEVSNAASSSGSSGTRHQQSSDTHKTHSHHSKHDAGNSTIAVGKGLPRDLTLKVSRRPSTGTGSGAGAAGGGAGAGAGHGHGGGSSGSGQSAKPQKSSLIRVGSHFVNLSKLKKFT